MGCANNQRCGGVAGAGIVGRDVVERQAGNCLECCSTDGCNSEMCKHLKPTQCVDDESIDCARLNTLFHVCQDIHQASLVCPKFCNLCTLVDGNWAQWSTWSNCDVTCANGTLRRTRTCTNPAPANGGLDCVGSSTDTKYCQKELCPVHGDWSVWSAWGTCSVSCGVGMQRRDRTCSNPYPSRNGDHCFADARDDRICLPGACSDGGWSSWGHWGSCSTSCGVGVRSRLRTCTNPKPSLLGRYCDGSPEQLMTCKKSTCPDHKVAFSAYGVSVNSNQLVFTNIIHNNGNSYSTVTGKFTCRVPGIYYFASTLTKTWYGITDHVACSLKVNGVAKVGAYEDPKSIEEDKGAYSISMSSTLHLNTGDTVYIGDCTGASALSNNNRCSFTGVLVTPDI